MGTTDHVPQVSKDGISSVSPSASCTCHNAWHTAECPYLKEEIKLSVNTRHWEPGDELVMVLSPPIVEEMGKYMRRSQGSERM